MIETITPASEGDVERDGVTLHYAVYGNGEPTLVFAPAFPVTSAGNLYSTQVPMFARRQRCVVYDAPGTGRSSREVDVARMIPTEWVADLLAVADATGTDTFVTTGISLGGLVALLTAAMAPDRVRGVVSIGAAITWDDEANAAPYRATFEERRDHYEGWERWNAHSIRTDYEGFLEFFIDQATLSAHRKAMVARSVEEALASSDPESPIAFIRTTLQGADPARLEAALSAVRCPVLLIHGDADEVVPVRFTQRTAELLGTEPEIIEGGTHSIPYIESAQVNGLIDDWLADFRPGEPTPVPIVARSGTPRILYLSSPIGLGHVRRDLAIADEIRKLAPDAQIDWLTQQPATGALLHAGEAVHPASDLLASENDHLRRHASGHGLDAARALHTMDTILCTNYFVFSDVLAAGDYDLVIGDEAWEVDTTWLDNPTAKRARYAWLTDFVGEIALPELGAKSAELIHSRNALMLHNLERHPGLRDLALFIGAPDDIVDDTFGPGLGEIRTWAEHHFDFTGGYITGLDIPSLPNRDELRSAFGVAPDETVVVVAVGGSGIGGALLHTAAAAHGQLRRLRPGLRTILVTGPCIDPAGMPESPGLDVRGWVPDLHHLLAVVDGAVVQGGLTTTMELTAAGVPFLYAPLDGHFEQQRHVHHRLRRHRAGQRIDHSIAADDLAERLDRIIGAPSDFVPVPTNGASVAAAKLVALL